MGVMRRTKARLAAGALAAVSGTALLSACGTGTGAGPDEIVIGVVEDASGPGAAYSKLGVAAIRAAVDDINADGGVLGKTLRVVARSDESNPSKSPTVTRRLIGQDGASAVLFTTGSGSIIANKTVLQDAKVPGIAATSFTTEVVAQPDADYMYIHVPSTVYQADTFAGAFRKIGARRIAIFTDTSAAIVSYVETYREKFAEAGFDLVAEERAPTDAKDVTAQVSRIASAEPDAVLVATVGGQAEVLFHNAAADMLRGVQRFSLASIGNQPQMWKLANPGALDGLVFTGALSADNPRTTELRQRLTASNGPEFRMTDYEAQAYSATRLMADAIERSGTGTPADVHKALNATTAVPSYFGQPSYTVSYAPDKHDGADGPCGLVLTVFRDNKPAGPWDVHQPACEGQS